MPIVISWILRIYSILSDYSEKNVQGNNRYQDEKKYLFQGRKHGSIGAYKFLIWATTRQNVSSGVSDQIRLKPACAATEANMRLEILVTETRGITLSRQRTTKALIRLHGCAGWSAPLLFAYGIRHIFSWSGSYNLVSYSVKRNLEHKLTRGNLKYSLGRSLLRLCIHVIGHALSVEIASAT